MSADDSPTGFLGATGDVAHVLVDVDWSATPMGDPADWPQSLTTVVRTLLASKFSMWMAWGPELTFFCNDAYRRDTLGSKFPWALGRPASTVWAEIWPDIGPRIASVMSTGEATWDQDLILFLERSGYVEETYHTFSYSPLTDDDGLVVGMLCVVVEETERVISNRQMALLRDLGGALSAARGQDDVFAAAAHALALEQRSIPFAALYLDGADAHDADGLHLVATAGIAADSDVAPPLLSWADDAPWPLSEVRTGSSVTRVADLAARFATIPRGAWAEPPREALLLPLSAAQPDAPPMGALIVGLNPFRFLEDSYAGFLGLVAAQLSAALAAGRAYDEERQRAEALVELDRAKTAFFTNVSHEFRTPLTLLLGPAEDALADADEPLPPGQRRRMELVHRNAQRLLKLVNTLLEFNRLEAAPALSLQPTDLAANTSELVEAFRPAVEREGLRLEVRLEPGLGPVRVDREMWAKIVLNLLSNALKFTFDGGITVSLTREGAAANGAATVTLTVADTGTGIPADQQHKLFQRFQRVDGARSRSHEGSGIGLALVAELAARHGGTVGLDSEEGRGSSFHVTLPLTADEDTGVAGTTPAAEAAAGAVALSGHLAEAALWAGSQEATAAAPSAVDGRPSVLVADDNADMRAYIGELLEQDYDVVTVADGQAALDTARSAPPDLVISDVMMPGLDGFELLTALHSDPVTAAVPVILLSARAGDGAVVEGLEAGADDYLAKPFSARELLARVRANLELDRVRRTRDDLVRSRTLLDQAQRLAGVGSWQLDVATGAVTGSTEFLRQTAFEVDDAGRADLAQIFTSRVLAEDLPHVQAALAQAAAGEPVDYEVRLRYDDGSVRTFHSVGEPVVDDRGSVVAIRGSNQDVTARKEAEQALARAAAGALVAAREHAIAEELQRSLLPAAELAADALDLAGFYRSGAEGTRVGGDWYDVIELGSGRTALVLGDVMGRGVRAAAVMGQLRSAVRAYARLDLPPADVLEFLDGAVRDLGTDDIVTCVYAVYDPSDRSLFYANAGHLPGLLLHAAGGVTLLSDAAGPPLGSGPLTLNQHRVMLTAGDTLLLYTDGLVERRDRDIDAGIATLADALARAQVPLDELPGRLVADVLVEGPDDDIAVLAARVPDGPDTQPALIFPIDSEPTAVAGARREVERCLTAWGVSESTLDDVRLLASELVTNAVVHGRASVEMRLRRARRHVMLEVRDGTAILPRRLRPAPEDEHGRGLQLTQLLAEQWGSRPEGSGKSVWCAVRLAR